MQAEHIVLILRTFYTFKKKTRKASASELAQKLGVSERSVYRYLNQVETAGIPLIHKRGSNGGFTLLDGGSD